MELFCTECSISISDEEKAYEEKAYERWVVDDDGNLFCGEECFDKYHRTPPWELEPYYYSEPEYYITPDLDKPPVRVRRDEFLGVVSIRGERGAV
jgi:hypothetical protein